MSGSQQVFCIPVGFHSTSVMLTSLLKNKGSFIYLISIFASILLVSISLDLCPKVMECLHKFNSSTKIDIFERLSWSLITWYCLQSSVLFSCYSGGALTVGLPPAWVDFSEEIAANIQRARTKMAELVKAHAKALMPSFGDGKEDQHAIEVLTQDITYLLKSSEKRLKKLSSSGPSEDSNLRKNVQRSLATDLQNLSVELRKKQSAYLKRLQQQKEGQDGVDLEMNLNGTKSKLDDDDDFVDIGFNDYQMSQLKKSEAFTKEREREIAQVVESVNELAQIMKDLSVLVIDQGTIVDRIDFNIQNTAVSVEEGFKQLQKAERSQRKGGMVRCATILVIMCFVMLVLLILKEILL